MTTRTENDVTQRIDHTQPIDAADAYRTPLPCETCSYELTGYTPTGSAGRYRDIDFVERVKAAPDQPEALLWISMANSITKKRKQAASNAG